MGLEKKGYKYFWLCLLAYMCGLMLKANIAPYPVFALVYLLIVKYDRKLLLKQCGILAAAVLCFVIPWTIRNYARFHAFVPLTYGAGNPALLGTYQGRNYPPDSQLDYVTNVDEVVREKYADYYNEKGSVKTEFIRYVSLAKDGVKASYRQQEWVKNDPVSFLYSHLVIKPRDMLTSIFYWAKLFGVPAEFINKLPYLEIVLCALAAAAAFAAKKYRAPLVFALGTYLVNIYIYATAFSFSRYNASVGYLKYVAIGIGLGAALTLIRKALGGESPVRDKLPEE